MCGPNSNHHHGTAGVDLNIDFMAVSQQTAAQNRQRLDAAGVRCLNLMSSPGTGKTTLLEATVAALSSHQRMAVIEGDMTTELDADRLRAHGVPVVAITTGRACHLDAELVAGGLAQLALDETDLLFIENVGNLVCPAEFPLGAHRNVVLVSVTEGDDKPLKYPVMFHEADCVVITKSDLLPYLRLDVDRLIANVHQIRPGIPVFVLSAESGAGMAEWYAWIAEQTEAAFAEPVAAVA